MATLKRASRNPTGTQTQALVIDTEEMEIAEVLYALVQLGILKVGIEAPDRLHFRLRFDVAFPEVEHFTRRLQERCAKENVLVGYEDAFTVVPHI